MQIDSTSHEHGASGKVFHYEGGYEVGAEAISWSAVVSHGGEQVQTFAGSIPISFPAMPALAEQTVRDEIVKRIDAFDDAQGSATGPDGGAALAPSSN